MNVPSWRELTRRAAILSAALAALAAAVVARPPTPSAASVDTVSFSTTPVLYPSFAADVSDYAVRCAPGTPVEVVIANSDGSDVTTTVSVDGQPPQTGSFVASVSLEAGREFTIEVQEGATTKDYYVRCLPGDFPTWTAQRPGTPQAEYYVVAPTLSFNVNASRYAIIYDTDGVPVWWMLPPSGNRPVDAKLAANGDVLWTTTSTLTGTPLNAAEVRLDGSFVDDTILPVGADPNEHEIQLLANGNYLMIGDYGRCCYDLTAYGGPAGATILDHVIQELTPGGSAVWTWDAADHVGLDEVGTQWWPGVLGRGTPYDVLHMNSVVVDAAGDLLVSARHENAVYKITNPTAPADAGRIIWKLGGSAPTIESGTHLTVVGDPVFDAGDGFGGQHYARYYDAGDGNLYVTLHDNQTNLGRPPRGVRYRIDQGAMTATLVEDVRDNADPGYRSICCGSAGKLPGGNWVTSLGFSHSVLELTPAGDRVFVLTFGVASYRADPVLPGALTRRALRAGMDAQYLRSIADADGDACPDVKEPLLVPPTDPNDPWDFYSVPVPVLMYAPSPLTTFRDSAVGAADAQAIFAYFKANAKAGAPVYEQDLNNNGIKDGIEYDRTVVGPGQSGPPDGAVTATDAQLAFAQFKKGYKC